MIDPPPPAELAFLTEAIGAEATLALIEARAGTRVYVPCRIDPGCPLAKMIGQDAALALAAQHGGCYIAVPSAKRWRATVYRARSMTNAQIALALRLNERTVERYFATDLGIRRHPTQVPSRRGEAAAIRQTEMPL
jgi:hypothetical protein